MVTVFFSYAHEDQAYRDVLEKHLAMLKYQGLVESWHDRRITAGAEIDEEISRHLEEAHIILLLVSPDFLASEYCYKREMKRAVARHQAGDAVVIPVILRPSDWHDAPFGKLRATPSDGKPITKFANLDDAYLSVARDVREAVAKHQKSKPTDPGTIRSGVPAQPSQAKSQLPRSSNLRIKRTFTDKEKDDFLEESFEYMAKFFESSLQELRSRNAGTEVRYSRGESRFTAAIYQSGKKRTSCRISLSSSGWGSKGIEYSASDSEREGGFTERLHLVDDGYSLLLEGMMHRVADGQTSKNLTQEGAAEFMWSMLLEPLQQR